MDTEQMDAKTCGHTRYTLHLGDLYLDARYFQDKSTYLGCEERKSASPRILTRLSEDLRECKRERNINDEDFSELIDEISRKIIAKVKEAFPRWASAPIPYEADLENQIAAFARREKAIAIDHVLTNTLDEYLGRKQLRLFGEETHFAYLKTVDCHWADAREGEHWFKFGNSKDPIKRYMGEQASLNQRETFGFMYNIEPSRAGVFESYMKALVKEAGYTTKADKDSKHRERFLCDMMTAARLFKRAYERARV